MALKLLDGTEWSEKFLNKINTLIGTVNTFDLFSGGTPPYTAGSGIAISGLHVISAESSESVRAYQSTTQSIPEDVNTQVVFQTTSWDEDSNFASNTFTTTLGGKFRINGQITFNVGSDQDALRVRVYANGAVVQEVLIRASGIYSQSVQYDVTAKILAGQDIEVWVQNYSNADSLTSGAQFTFIQIERLGA